MSSTIFRALQKGYYRKYIHTAIPLDFIKTKGLKIAAQLQKGASGGVIEWKVN